MTSKYKYLPDGDMLPIEQETDKNAIWQIKLMCCDCGLVHTVNFGLLKNEELKRVLPRDGVLVRAHFRDNRATAQVRRHRQFRCKEKGK